MTFSKASRKRLSEYFVFGFSSALEGMTKEWIERDVAPGTERWEAAMAGWKVGQETKVKMVKKGIFVFADGLDF